VEERFVAQDPRRAQLGIGDPPELVAERTVVVHTERAGEEQPIVQPDLLLAVAADGGVDGVALRGRERRRGTRDGGDAGPREADPAKEALVQRRAIPLTAER